jgi:outer membrane receptor protein involved in Fe transport
MKYKNSRYWLPGLLTGALGVSVAGASSDAPIHFRTQAQDLSSALVELGRQSGVQVLFAHDTVRGHHAQDVDGVYTVPEALARVLEGSGLVVTQEGDGAIFAVQSRPSVVPARASVLVAQASVPVNSAPALPAAGPARAAESVERGGQLQEIVVTARKTAESLQKVPITVTAFNSEALEAIAPKTLFDMTILTPSLNYQEINPGRGGSRIQMRGVTGGNTGTSRASVFLDGVFMAGSINNIPFQALERVEVMPGPQSAQFGRSTFAGAINFITRDPGQEFSGTLDVNYGTLGEEEAFLSIGGPISDRLRGGLYAWHQAYEGDWVSVQGAKIGTTLTRAFGGRLVFDATENLTLKARTYYSQDWDDVSLAQWLDPVFIKDPKNPYYVTFVRGDGTTGRWVTGETPAIPFDAKNASRAVNPKATEIRDRRNSIRQNLQADYALGEHSLSFNAGYSLERYTPAQRGGLLTQMSFINNPNFGLDSNVTHNELKSTELRLASPTDRRLRYSMGLFWQDLDTRSKGVSYAANVCLSTCTLDVLGTYRVNTAQTRTDTDVQVVNRSVFGSVSYDFTDRTTLSLEGRYQREDVSNKNLVTSLYVDGSWNSFLPRVNLQYRPTDDLQFYAVYSVGNNPGVFNTSQFLGLAGTGTSLSQRQADEEKLINYELGVKSTWLDNTLLLNAAIFNQQWKDMQFPQTYFAPGGGTTFMVVENRGSSEINGIELESQWAPAENLTLRATVSYNAGEYKNYCSGNYAQLLIRSDVPAPNFCIFVNGKKFENVPRLTRSLSVDYRRPLAGDWRMSARASYQYQAGMYTEEWNASSSPSATLFTGTLGFQKGPLTIEAYCRNCSEEDSPARIGRSTDTRLGPLRADNFAIGYIFRRPRQYGLHARYEF